VRVGRDGLDLGASGDVRCRPPCAQQACSRCPTRCQEYLCGTIGHQTGAGVTGSACAAVLLVGQARHQHHHEGRASAGAARRLCADLHVVFTRYCSALLMTRLTSHAAPLYASSRRSAAPRALCFNEACASIGPHARHFARAADSASACSSAATAAQVVSPNNPQPRSSVALGAGFGRHGGGSRAHEPGPSRAMKTLREGSAQNRSRVARM